MPRGWRQPQQCSRRQAGARAAWSRCHPAGFWVACRICQLAVMLARDMTTTGARAPVFSSAPGHWVVAVTVLGSGIAALDATVVNIALSTIGREFHTGVADLQWVISGYTLTL